MKAFLAVTVMSLAMLAGCSPSRDYAALASEDEIAELAELKARTEAAPSHTAIVPTGDAPSIGIAIHELTAPGHDRILVMVHGVLSDHRAWRFMAGELAQSYDLMLVDLPGCGESDKPAPGALGPQGYSPGAMAARVLGAVRERVLARDDADRVRVTLVAHSLGGAVAMRMFCDQELATTYGDLLERVDSVVLLSPMDISVNKPDPMFRQIAEISGTEIALGDATGLLESKVAKATRNSVVSSDRALRAEADTRLSYFRDSARRRAAQAMLRQAIPWKDERPDWGAIEPVEQEYCRIELPTLILWGRRDETLPVAMGYKLAAELPKARLVCLPEVMHSPHIEAPSKTIALIREFVDGGVESGGPAHAER
jgi:pimeloyl-ACP methyl ester carboxylesterase